MAFNPIVMIGWPPMRCLAQVSENGHGGDHAVEGIATLVIYDGLFHFSLLDLNWAYPLYRLQDLLPVVSVDFSTFLVREPIETQRPQSRGGANLKNPWLAGYWLLEREDACAPISNEGKQNLGDPVVGLLVQPQVIG